MALKCRAGSIPARGTMAVRVSAFSLKPFLIFKNRQVIQIKLIKISPHNEVRHLRSAILPLRLLINY